MDPAALSRILNGKQELSPKACPQILRSIKAPPADCEMFVASVLAERETIEFKSIFSKLQGERSAASPKPLPRKIYDRLVNRYHGVILALFDRPDFSSEIRWIAQQANTTEMHVEWIISVLIRAGFVRRDGDRLHRISEDPYCETPTAASPVEPATEHAEVSPNRLPACRRVRIDPRNLAAAQSRLENFLSELEKEFGPDASGKECWISAQFLLRP